ncbi:Helix-turn-helix domain protein [Adhaeretor mobilis]|uniref:Helix-turn-helix domain protein n=2 Tax=Adhaeretor mobilis TaxID=1930276 RepID=A0A517MS22_9BACT|nr:Helix-turn-helix domain protein [Adhaeretor mobilis]
MPKLDEYLQITEAAEMLGVCRNTLRNWGHSGRIEEHRHPINNYRLYKRADLEQLLRETEKSVKAKRKPR